MDGSHERQIEFMDGRGRVEGWGEEEHDYDEEDEEAENADDEETEGEQKRKGGGGREGRWECGRGRCAVTGRRVLGGAEGLRRVIV